MGLFKKFFSKTEDSEMDFATSELKEEKNANFQKKNTKIETSSSEKKSKHSEKEDSMEPDAVRNLLKSVMATLQEGSAEQKILKDKLDDDNGFRNVHVKTTNSLIIKNGDHIYKSDKADSRITDAVNELLNEFFDEKEK